MLALHGAMMPTNGATVKTYLTMASAKGSLRKKGKREKGDQANYA